MSVESLYLQISEAVGKTEELIASGKQDAALALIQQSLQELGDKYVISGHMEGSSHLLAVTDMRIKQDRIDSAINFAFTALKNRLELFKTKIAIKHMVQNATQCLSECDDLAKESKFAEASAELMKLIDQIGFMYKRYPILTDDRTHLSLKTAKQNDQDKEFEKAARLRYEVLTYRRDALVNYHGEWLKNFDGTV